MSREIEEHERGAMIDSLMDSRGEALPENPPPGPKWKAKQALNSLNLNGAEHDVMGCLLDRANAHTGLCYPSEEYVAGWTNRPLRTVERAIASLTRKRLIKIIHRGTTSNRYYIDWHRLFVSFRAMVAFQKRRLRQSDALQTFTTRRVVRKKRCPIIGRPRPLSWRGNSTVWGTHPCYKAQITVS